MLCDDGDVVAGVEEEDGCLKACDAGAGEVSECMVGWGVDGERGARMGIHPINPTCDFAITSLECFERVEGEICTVTHYIYPD